MMTKDVKKAVKITLEHFHKRLAEIYREISVLEEQKKSLFDGIDFLESIEEKTEEESLKEICDKEHAASLRQRCISLREALEKIIKSQYQCDLADGNADWMQREKLRMAIEEAKLLLEGG
jgi:hypothetical protein